MKQSKDSSASSSTPITSSLVAVGGGSADMGSGDLPTAGGNNVATTASSGDADHLHFQQQQQILQNQEIATTATTSTITPTKNQLNNLLGCGPSSSSTTKDTTTTVTTAAEVAAAKLLNKGGTNNLKSSNTLSYLNNNTSTLGHQSSNSNSSSNNKSKSNTLTTTTVARNNAVAAAATTLSTNSASISASTTGSSFSCSSSATPPSSQMAPINLNISTTTGGNFSVAVDPQITVENLKKIIAKKLKVAKDRICLLHREKELQDGLLKENNLIDGSKIILIPNVETGLLAQRPENTVMQALESLNDSQVNDFLSGKTPLNLSMRLGDHMMLIQLQLSTVNPVNGVAHNGTSSCGSSSSRQRSNHHHHHHHHRSNRMAATTSAATQTIAGGTAATVTNHNHHHHHHHHHHHGSNTVVAAGPTATATLPSTSVTVATTAQNVTAVRKLELDATCQTPTNNGNTSSLITPHTSTKTTAAINGCMTPSSSSSSLSMPATGAKKSSDLSSFLSKRDYESLQNIVKSIAMAQPSHLVQQSVVADTSNSGSQLSSSSLTSVVTSAVNTSAPITTAPSFHAPSEAVLLEQSPIKSLSNLVSSPIKTTSIKNIPNISNNANSSSPTNSVAIGPHTASLSAVSASSSNNSAAVTSAMCQDPISAKLTSCLCTRLNGGLGVVNNMQHASTKQCIETACVTQQQHHNSQHHHQHQQLQIQPHSTRTITSTIMSSASNYKTNFTPASITTSVNGPVSSRSSSSLHKTAHNPIARKHRHHHHHHHHHHHYHHPVAVQQLNNVHNQKVFTNTSTPIKGLANDSGFNSSDDSSLNALTKSCSPTSTNNMDQPLVHTNSTPVVVAAAATPLTTSSSTLSSSANAAIATPIELDDSGIVSDSRTLAEASRNLTQTLRKLSKEVFTNKIDFSASEETPRKSGSGAVIESMKNHGKGIYSGTFSGTLNPALQDRYGRPKRDISTVIHILNDLLSATPQYHRGARISFEAPSTSTSAAASVAAASGSTSIVHHSSRNKHLSSKHHQSSHPCVKCIKSQNSSSSSVNIQSASSINAAGTIHSHTSSLTALPSSSSTSPICVYGECNGHYASSKSQPGKIYPCCEQDATPIAASSSSASALTQQKQHPALSTSVSTNMSNVHHHHHGASHHHHHHHHQMIDERKVCQCRYRVHAATGERERDYTCQKCAAELDNIKTKSKLDQLRLVMQQRKQKREARKLKGAPYGARVVGTTTTAATSGITDPTTSTLTASNSTIATPISVATSTTTTPSEVSPNHLVEEVDTAA